MNAIFLAFETWKYEIHFITERLRSFFFLFFFFLFFFGVDGIAISSLILGSLSSDFERDGDLERDFDLESDLRKKNETKT